MYDDLREEVGVFDFDEFADLLLDQGLEASPSQLHGCLTGLLAAGAPHEPESGLDALTQSMNIDLFGELAERVMQLYSVTALALQDDEFTFMPLLPGDEEEISLRAAALANWCEGFLAGFAFRLAVNEPAAGALSVDVSEVLRDIAAMAQAEAGADDDEDDAENSFIELVEYLRIAVINVFMESSALVSQPSVSPDTTRSLH
jgi:yecA family protein